MLVINNRIEIPLEELQFHYVRSSGPGGQNVNKVATKAVLHWDFEETESLPTGVKERFRARYGNRINAAGELVVSCDRHRSQTRNAEECLERVRALILDVVEPPTPRIPKKPSRASKRRRVEDKRRLSAKKSLRKSVSRDE